MEFTSSINEKLKHNNLRTETLQELKQKLATTSQLEALQIAKLINASLLYDCLNDSDVHQINLTCEIITNVLKLLPAGTSLEIHSKCLTKCLKHSKTHVKIMALEEIQMYTYTEELTLNLCKNASLVYTILQHALCSDSLDASVISLTILLAITKHDKGILLLQSKEFVQILQYLLKQPNKLRIQEFILTVSSEIEEIFESYAEAAVISAIIDDLFLNNCVRVLEFVIPLATSSHGYEYLDKENFFSKIFTLEKYTNIKFKKTICVFLAKLIYWRPMEMVTKYKEQVKQILSYSSSDTVDVPYDITINFLIIVTKSDQGKLALDALDENLFEAIENIGKSLNILTDKKLHDTLACIHNLIKIDSNEHRMVEIAAKWFELLKNYLGTFICKKFNNNCDKKILQNILDIVVTLSQINFGQMFLLGATGVLQRLLELEFSVDTTSKLLIALNSLVKCEGATYEQMQQLQEYILCNT